MADVARFPPLPEIPLPVATSPDERQQVFHRIIGGLAGGMSDQGQVATANTAAGYRASAVDLGALQILLSAAIVRFDITQVQDRWKEDLFDWMRRAVLTWVQRCKMLRMTIEEHGIHFVLQTQDDHGYYRYEFDVFPGIKRSPRAD
jgi:hypothetical protein